MRVRKQKFFAASHRTHELGRWAAGVASVVAAGNACESVEEVAKLVVETLAECRGDVVGEPLVAVLLASEASAGGLDVAAASRGGRAALGGEDTLLPARATPAEQLAGRVFAVLRGGCGVGNVDDRPRNEPRTDNHGKVKLILAHIVLQHVHIGDLYLDLLARRDIAY